LADSACIGLDKGGIVYVVELEELVDIFASLGVYCVSQRDYEELPVFESVSMLAELASNKLAEC
jgi:hypothetical protein